MSTESQQVSSYLKHHSAIRNWPRLYEAAEVVDALAACLAETEEALREVSNAYGCFASCTGALPGAPAEGSGHTPACRRARAVLAGEPADEAAAGAGDNT